MHIIPNSFFNIKYSNKLNYWKALHENTCSQTCVIIERKTNVQIFFNLSILQTYFSIMCVWYDLTQFSTSMAAVMFILPLPNVSQKKYTAGVLQMF